MPRPVLIIVYSFVRDIVQFTIAMSLLTSTRTMKMKRCGFQIMGNTKSAKCHPTGIKLRLYVGGSLTLMQYYGCEFERDWFCSLIVIYSYFCHFCEQNQGIWIPRGLISTLVFMNCSKQLQQYTHLELQSWYYSGRLKCPDVLLIAGGTVSEHKMRKI